ncbi:hypothetical protein RFI_00671 [Reticulomyxa filosa]|uniref:RGS domain-containing protein n=1 Tax=Reticulomyxa filosa TaxID=46433 RepID=X6PE85_RETFI|nr:hypothetical protein RFI_00671 [Reticulomyxa filosa]|eukprot:ETO36393.1 hypothetical protein RFI_00671 [Reticulomyxa filosa]
MSANNTTANVTTALATGGTYIYLPGAMVIVALWVVFVPITVYFLREYQKYSSTMFIQKRKGTLTTIFLTVILFQLGIGAPIFVGLTNAWYGATNIESLTWYYRIGNFMYYIGSQFFAYAVECASLWKIMMIWWEYNEYEALQNEAWVQYLKKRVSEGSRVDRTGTLERVDSVLSVSQQGSDLALDKEADVGHGRYQHEWIFRNKRYWGNQWWVFRRLFLWWFIESSITWFFYAFSDYNAVWDSPWWDSTQVYYYEYVVYSSHAIAMWIFWLRTPAFYDSFKIRNEIRYLMIAETFGPCVYWLWFFYGGAIDPNIGYTLLVVVFYLQSFGRVMGTVGYTIIRGKSLGYLSGTRKEPSVSTENASTMETGSHEEKSVTKTSSPATPPMGSSPRPKSHNTETNPSSPTKKIRLRQVLQHRKTLDLFAQHLVSEFSIECLLSVIEFSQFRLLLGTPQKSPEEAKDAKDAKDSKDAKDAKDMKDDSIVDLPHSKLPQSQIVYGQFHMKSEWKKSGDAQLDEYKIRAYYLFIRYINSSTAELEINISYR